MATGESRSRQRVPVLTQWAVVATSQFRDYLRTYRFLGLVVFVAFVSVLWFAFLVAAGTGLVQLSFLDSVSEFLTDYTTATPLWIVLAGAFFGGDALSQDFHTGTGTFSLVLPVERPTLLAGRYASATAVTLVVVGEYTLFGVLAASYEFGRSAIPWGDLATSLGLSVLFTLAVVSVAFCFSAFFKAPSTGVLVTVLVLAVGIPTLDGVVQIAGVEPVWSISYAGGAISSALDWAYTPKQVISVGAGRYLTAWSASTTEGAAIMLAYLVVSLVACIILYQRKESKG